MPESDCIWVEGHSFDRADSYLPKSLVRGFTAMRAALLCTKKAIVPELGELAAR